MDEEGKYNNGRWSTEEHNKFLYALELYGKEWKKVQEFVGTRTSTQARSHAQKYFSKLEKTTTPVSPIKKEQYYEPKPKKNSKIKSEQHSPDINKTKSDIFKVSLEEEAGSKSGQYSSKVILNISELKLPSSAYRKLTYECAETDYNWKSMVDIEEPKNVNGYAENVDMFCDDPFKSDFDNGFNLP